MRPVDYALIYRLEDERHARENAYVCPFWDQIRAIADQYGQKAWWWEPHDSMECNGQVAKNPRTGTSYFCDECSGEIPWR